MRQAASSTSQLVADHGFKRSYELVRELASPWARGCDGAAGDRLGRTAQACRAAPQANRHDGHQDGSSRVALRGSSNGGS